MVEKVFTQEPVYTITLSNGFTIDAYHAGLSKGNFSIETVKDISLLQLAAEVVPYLDLFTVEYSKLSPPVKYEGYTELVNFIRHSYEDRALITLSKPKIKEE